LPLYTFEGRRPNLPVRERYWVAPSAEVIGDITLEEDVSIWFGAVLRGDNEAIHLGRGTNIQEGCMLHTDPGYPMRVGSGVTVGHHAILHGCTVGDNSLIGMGATILNGARIGTNCLVGANALVTEGKIFPDNSMIVGAPAKVIREVDDVLRATLLKSSIDYIARWKRFHAGLTSLEMQN